jgi:hypothetical protein
MDAFRSYRVVALGEGSHHNIQGHLFRLSLLRDRRFAQKVNDIVVECGNALYQGTIDRFVRGEEVPYPETAGFAFCSGTLLSIGIACRRLTTYGSSRTGATPSLLTS